MWEENWFLLLFYVAVKAERGKIFFSRDKLQIWRKDLVNNRYLGGSSCKKWKNRRKKLKEKGRKQVVNFFSSSSTLCNLPTSLRSHQTVNVLLNQSDQIGRNLAFCLIIFFGTFYFENYTSSPRFWVHFCKNSYVLNCAKYGLGYLLGYLWPKTFGHCACFPGLEDVHACFYICVCVRDYIVERKSIINQVSLGLFHILKSMIWT
jgi:hypothetical protein